MKTKVIKVDPGDIDLKKIKQAAEVIKKGGIVAFPTETVYGLAADFFNEQAVAKVMKLKRRPDNKPLTVQIEDITYLEKLGCEISGLACQLMSKFWPGPLTLVLPLSHIVGQRRTLGVRIPSNKIARSLIKAGHTPIVAPSANISGEPAAKDAQAVVDSFDGLIELIIDAGPAQLGIASTVVDLSVSPFRILREGAIKPEEIQDAQG